MSRRSPCACRASSRACPTKRCQVPFFCSVNNLTLPAESDRHRAPGSIGQTTTPGRVFKGKKMAGHMGASQLTVRNLEVVDVDIDKNLLLVKGSVPGSQNGLLIIEKIGKAKASVVPSPPKAATTEITEKAHESTEEESVSSVVAKEEKTPEVKQNA